MQKHLILIIVVIGYYMSDIATAIFSFIVDPETPLENNRNDLFFSYLEPFRKGYETEFTLPDTEWNKVDDFVRLRFLNVPVCYLVLIPTQYGKKV